MNDDQEFYLALLDKYYDGWESQHVLVKEAFVLYMEEKRKATALMFDIKIGGEDI